MPCLGKFRLDSTLAIGNDLFHDANQELCKPHQNIKIFMSCVAGASAAMEIELPTLLSCGGHEFFAEYSRVFDELYRAQPFVDVLGRTVTFDDESCRHVCFEKDPFHRSNPAMKHTRLVWSQERAERIPWIGLALSDPAEIRWNHQVNNHQAYLLAVPQRNVQRPAIRYYVSVHSCVTRTG